MQPLSPRAREAFFAEMFQKYNNKHATFQRAYFYDPVGFMRDCIKWEEGQVLFPYQIDVANRLVQNKRLAVRGPRGLGKSMIAALLIWWYALTREGKNWKIVTSAGAWSQLTNYLWPEIHKWWFQIDWDKVGRPMPRTEKELLTTGIKLDEKGQAIAASPTDAKLIEGAHADYNLYLFDEAKAIDIKVWDAVEGGMATGIEKLFLAISTPGEEIGRFYEICTKQSGYEDWDTIHVTYQQCAEARGETYIKWAEDRKRQWGEQTQPYKNYVLGEFAQSDEGAIIPLGWIEMAVERWKEWRNQGFPGEYTGLGVDVGLGGVGSDKITMAVKYDEYKIKEIRAFARANPEVATMEIVGHAKGIADKLGRDKPIVPDIIGIGAGVGHRLAELE
jgi:hypothetical protein